MKKILAFFVCGCLFMMPCASSASESEMEMPYDELLEKYEQLQADYEKLEKQLAELTSESKDSKPGSSATLDDLESYLLDCGVLQGEKTEMAASMVGAESGFKYSESGAEVYMYDEASKTLSELQDGEPVILEGFDVEMYPAAINGVFVMFSDNPPQELVDAFENFEIE